MSIQPWIRKAAAEFVDWETHDGSSSAFWHALNQPSSGDAVDAIAQMIAHHAPQADTHRPAPDAATITIESAMKLKGEIDRLRSALAASEQHAEALAGELARARKMLGHSTNG